MVHHEGLGDMSFLKHCPLLASLILHNVLGVDAAVETIKEIKNLRYLDNEIIANVFSNENVNP